MLYHVYGLVKRDSREYLGMIYVDAKTARQAEEHLKFTFQGGPWNGRPHIFRVKAFRDDKVTPDTIESYYGPELVRDRWGWSFQFGKPLKY